MIESLELKAWVVLARTMDAISDRVKEDLRRHQLNSTEFGVLSVLYKRGDTPLQQIGDQILITSGSVTYVIDKLEKRGLIERIACPSDRRVTYASLTDDGKALMDVVYPQHIEIFKDIYGPLSDEETEQLISLLKQVGYNAAGK
ncbi:transcriptional regulator, MarR family [Exiguobacterium sp. AT1b]|uniref:Transcriptional regulator, MarR family n=1 Tax=Exiguobacterium sp. (strain ATCC BAA-1283 / AT1b) TaxID=360911 RepID=C4L0W7_EXISA|nr:MarR family transcriptional regulator [Exiguobacterium sp. AT1b]ACQ70930.1 transcriptional regulator, MarR family [Exiguobacterium sp. AT1b]